MSDRPGYRKGDEMTGGGGSRGGAGKRKRPAEGFEKGDVARGLYALHPEQIPVKPGRDVPHTVAQQPPTSLGKVATGPTLYELLRATNAKLLKVLQKLEDEKQEDERHALLARLDRYYAEKRRIEDDYLFPLLLDHPEVSDDVVTARDEATDTQALFDRLKAAAPASRNEFKFALAALHGQIEQQVKREEQTILPKAERVVALEDAVGLADEIRAGES